MRPLYTGWFAEFAAVERTARDGEVAYGPGAARFAGATYDPVSHYRAAAVFAFHREQGLTPEVLRTISQQQTARLATAIDALDLPPEHRPGRRRCRPSAGRASWRSSARMPPVWRGRWRSAAYGATRVAMRLRLGPAPYVTNEQLFGAVTHLGDLALGSRADPAR